AWAGPAPAAAGSDAVATGPAAAAASSPAAATEAAGGTDAVEHVVNRGENAWTIARRYGVRVADLLERNGLSARAVLRPGQRLLIRALGPGPR
ncbi:LysM domain-containing protein, partial [Cutibacterium acnes]